MRGIIIVLDGVGIGELPDAYKYGDEGSNTLMNIKRAVPQLQLKNMCSLGLGNIQGENIYERTTEPLGVYGKLAEKSAGKDTTTGHWEISGIWIEKPFPTYPNGFPKEVIAAFEKAVGRKVIGNCVASGTEIIKELGQKHIETGCPIVYTSADSVFQIACHTDVIALEQLYEMCEKARNILVGEHGVGRVIARPFTTENGEFKRTSDRHDYSLEPIDKTLLDYVKEAGMEVMSVGKIKDIFADRGITGAIKTKNNKEGIDATISLLKQDFSGIIFTNLVDYDMLYGHRNNVQGFADALQEFDDRLPEIMEAMNEDDFLVITADHGCDPTTASTDHSREYIFMLGYGKNIVSGDIGIRSTYSDIGKTMAKYLNIENDLKGQSFLD